MRNSFFLFLSQYRPFWVLRSLVYRVSFWFGASAFLYRFSVRENKDNLFGMRHLFQITQVQLVLTLLFAVLLQLVDPVVYRYYDFTFFTIPDDGDYVTFLATISGIGGVFIGLYYAAISTIGGSIYAKVPNNIRDLLAQERIGNVYMHLLSFTTFLGISLISFRILGFQRVYIAIPVMLVASGVGIIAFVKLGQRAFYLFDPTALSHHLFGQLRQYVKMAKAGGYRWDDAAFQRHANKLASSSLDTLETLSDITKKEEHLRGAPFISLSEKLLSFMMFYEFSKKHIPSSSQWYEQKYVHRDWYLTEDTGVSIAHQTGTSLQPEIANDKVWLEKRVFPIIIECFAINLREERYNEVLALTQYLDSYLRLLARNGRTTYALEFLEEVGATVIDVLSPASDKKHLASDVLEKLATIERLASMPITIALACREHIEDTDSRTVKNRISKIDWGNKAALYKHDFPFYCLPRLEWFMPRIQFEIATVGHKVTPTWYQKELLLQIESETFVENTDALVNRSSQLYSNWITKVTDAKQPWLVGAFMSREWEFWHKVDHQTAIWPEKWSSLSDEKKIEGLPWSTFDYDKLSEARESRKMELLKLMSTHHLVLAFLDKPEGFPDYAGQFLHTTGEVVFEALLTNNEDLLRNVFAPYLYGCMLRFNKLRPQSSTVDWRAQQDFKIAAAPLLDLMELSGYSRLMAEYHNNDQLWSIVVTAWSKYIADLGAESPLPLLAGVIAITAGGFEIPHRGVLRTNWKMRIGQRLLDVPRREILSRGFDGSHSEIDHESPLIRIFARGPHGSYDGIDIFVTYYLRTIEGAETLEYGRIRRNLQESLDREVRRYERSNREDPPQ